MKKWFLQNNSKIMFFSWGNGFHWGRKIISYELWCPEVGWELDRTSLWYFDCVVMICFFEYGILTVESYVFPVAVWSNWSVYHISIFWACYFINSVHLFTYNVFRALTLIKVNVFSWLCHNRPQTSFWHIIDWFEESFLNIYLSVLMVPNTIHRISGIIYGQYSF